MNNKENEIVSRIEGIGPAYGKRLAKIGVKNLDDLRSMNINSISEKTQISKEALAQWQGMAILQQVRGLDHQISEVLVHGGITNLRKLVDADPNNVLQIIKDAKWPKEGRKNPIPDDYTRIITSENVLEWQREASLILSPQLVPPVASPEEELYEQVEIFFDSNETVFPTRFMFQVTELDSYLVYEYWLYYPRDYFPNVPLIGRHKHDLEGFYIFVDKQSHKPSLAAATCHWELHLQKNPSQTIKLYVERGKHAFYFEKKSGLQRANGREKANIPWSSFTPLKDHEAFLNNITGPAEKWRVEPLIQNPEIHNTILLEAAKDKEIIAIPSEAPVARKCVEREQKCKEWEETQKKKCAEYKDKGYRECTETRDEGYKKCCDWWPCSWACSAWAWVSNIVCVASVWISNIVCVAWTWVTVLKCKASVWVCKAWVEVTDC